MRQSHGSRNSHQLTRTVPMAALAVVMHDVFKVVFCGKYINLNKITKI